MKNGYLLRDQQEKFNLKRGWFVVAWRIVDENRSDLIQPWMSTKSEAKRIAAQCEINIIGELK